MKPDNVTSLMAQEEIDGALVGGVARPEIVCGDREVLRTSNFLLDPIPAIVALFPSYRHDVRARAEDGRFAFHFSHSFQ